MRLIPGTHTSWCMQHTATSQIEYPVFYFLCTSMQVKTCTSGSEQLSYASTETLHLRTLECRIPICLTSSPGAAAEHNRLLSLSKSLLHETRTIVDSASRACKCQLVCATRTAPLAAELGVEPRTQLSCSRCHRTDQGVQLPCVRVLSVLFARVLLSCLG